MSASVVVVRGPRVEAVAGGARAKRSGHGQSTPAPGPPGDYFGFVVQQVLLLLVRLTGPRAEAEVDGCRVWSFSTLIWVPPEYG
ncbi:MULTISPECIES: hypothetical protein [unclassified Streptomyces]|nr:MULTISPECIES: hypothetical protein [unclassified Streptomyces]